MIKEWILKWLFDLNKKDKYVAYINEKVDIPLLNEKDEGLLIEFLYTTTRSIILKETFSIRRTLIVLCVSIFTDLIMRHREVILSKLQSAETLDDMKKVFLELDDGNDSR